MRLLLVGGNGFIGTPLANQLIQAGHQVAIFHRNVERPGVARALQIRGDRNRLPDYKDELADFGAQVIIDLVLSSGWQADQVAATATDLGARVVAVSSMDVYRAWGVVLEMEPGGLEPLPITEESPLRTARRTYPPEAVKTMKAIFTWLNEEYDKVAVEQAVMRGGDANTVVRLPMVYGPGDPLHRMHGVLKRIADGKPAIILAEDHAAWRAPRGYVENVAHAIALAATSPRAPGRTYHICEEPCLSELEWQKNIVAQTSWKGNLVLLPNARTPKHLLMHGNASQHVAADCERIRSELGYKELVRVDEAIRRTIAWERENPPAGPGIHKFDYAAEDAALA
jgi:nucleoside-diphosphate-sugar epimerase